MLCPDPGLDHGKAWVLGEAYVDVFFGIIVSRSVLNTNTSLHDTRTRYPTDVFANPSSRPIQPLLFKAKMLNAGLSGIAVCPPIAARATRTMHGYFAADMQRSSYTIFYSPQQEVYFSVTGP